MLSENRFLNIEHTLFIRVSIAILALPPSRHSVSAVPPTHTAHSHTPPSLRDGVIQLLPVVRLVSLSLCRFEVQSRHCHGGIHEQSVIKVLKKEHVMRML